MPDSLEKASGVSAFSAQACFAISITNEKNQPTTSNSCDPGYGKFVGLVSPGEAIEMELERGSGYSIDLYYVISESGCSKIEAANGLGKTFGSNKVYRVAHQTGLDFNSSQVTVELHIQWPHQSNTLATLHNLPLSCKKGDDPIDKMALREAGLVMGAAHGTTTGNHFMRVRVKDQSLNPKIENWGGRILPARLGDDQ